MDILTNTFIIASIAFNAITYNSITSTTNSYAFTINKITSTTSFVTIIRLITTIEEIT